MITLPYKILAGAVLFASLVGGCIWYGYNKAEDKYLAIIATYKSEAELLQAKLDASLGEVKVEVLTKYVDRVRTVKEKEYVYRDKIITVPSKCELSTGWVSLHNASATSGDAESAGTTDATSSGIKDTEALDTVIGNYSICHQNAEQLKALQEWIVYAQEVIEQQNKEARER